MIVTLSNATIRRLRDIGASDDSGGYQSLVRLLRGKVGQFGFTIELTDTEVERLERYSQYGTGNGGYQKLFRLILTDARN